MKAKVVLTFVFLLLSVNKAFAVSELTITEVFPNPFEDEKSGEFIEIFNNSDQAIDITEYYINEYSVQFYFEESFLVEPEEFVIIHDDEIELKARFPGIYKRAIVQNLTSRGLSNTGETINLIKNEEIIDSFTYEQSIEGLSLFKATPECENAFTQSYSVTDSTTIGNFNNIFEIPEIDFKILVYDQGEWKSNGFANQSPLKFKLTHSKICEIENSNISFKLKSTEYTLEDENIVNSNIFSELELIHKPTNSIKTYELINLEPEPTPVPTIAPTTIPSPIPSPSVSPTPTTIPLNHDYKDILISEVYPSPNTGEEEWVELYNKGNKNISLENFKLKDKTSSQILENIQINAKEFIVIESPQLKISLNNTGDDLVLENPTGNIIDNFIYGNTPKGNSQIFYNNLVKLSIEPTYGETNILETEIIEENNEVSEELEEEISETINYSDKIRINEIYPNPQKGETEWVEIHNFGNEDIILENWKLKDKTSTHTLSELVLKAGEYIVLENLKITLNNGGDEITLFNPNENEISKVTYPEIKTAESYAFYNDDFQITQNVTKAKPNLIENSEHDIQEDDESINNTQNESSKTDTNNMTGSESSDTTGTIQKPRSQKLPKKYNSNEVKELVEDTQEVSKSQKKFPNYFKETGLIILSLTGFVNTPMGKEMLCEAFKKLNSMAA